MYRKILEPAKRGKIKKKQAQKDVAAVCHNPDASKAAKTARGQDLNQANGPNGEKIKWTTL